MEKIKRKQAFLWLVFMPMYLIALPICFILGGLVGFLKCAIENSKQVTEDWMKILED